MRRRQGRQRRLDGLAARRVGKAHVDGLLQATIRTHGDGARVHGERAEIVALGRDARSGPRGISVEQRQQAEEFLLLGRQQLGIGLGRLGQIAHQKPHGVQRARRQRRMAADALGEDAGTPGLPGLDRDAVGMRARRRQPGRVDGEHQLGLTGDGVRRLRPAPRDDPSVAHGRAQERGTEATLLRVTDRELRIGREQERRLGMSLQIVMDVRHAHLFVAPQERPDGVARRDAVAQQVRARVETEHRRAFVVDDTAAHEPAVAAAHGPGVAVPARTSGNHVHVGDGRNLFLALTGNVADADVSPVVRDLVAQPRRDAQRTIERRAHIATIGSTGLHRARIRHGRMGDERGDVVQHVVPHLVDVRVDARFQILSHKSLLIRYARASPYRS